METAIVVFTRDLRLHDNPALHQACSRARQPGTGWTCLSLPPRHSCRRARVST